MNQPPQPSTGCPDLDQVHADAAAELEILEYESGSHGANGLRAHTSVGPQRTETNPDSYAYGTQLARVSAGALGLEASPQGSDAKRNGFHGSRAGARIGPEADAEPAAPGALDHWGSVPDDERASLAAGFGAELVRLRKACALSQARLGDLAGLRGDHVGRLERGQRRPTLAAIRALSRVIAPDAERGDVRQRLAALAGTSLREGAERKKQARDNKHRLAALRSAEQASRRLHGIIRAKEAAGELVAGNLRRMAGGLGNTAERLRAETPTEPQGITGFRAPEPRRVGRKLDRPASRSLKDIEAWLNSHQDDPGV